MCEDLGLVFIECDLPGAFSGTPSTLWTLFFLIQTKDNQSRLDYFIERLVKHTITMKASWCWSLFFPVFIFIMMFFEVPCVCINCPPWFPSPTYIPSCSDGECEPATGIKVTKISNTPNSAWTVICAKWTRQAD